MPDRLPSEEEIRALAETRRAAGRRDREEFARATAARVERERIEASRRMRENKELAEEFLRKNRDVPTKRRHAVKAHWLYGSGNWELGLCPRSRFYSPRWVSVTRWDPPSTAYMDPGPGFLWALLHRTQWKVDFHPLDGLNFDPDQVARAMRERMLSPS